MTFISYAQNFEDVILWRALKHVENGFYIDIGAQDPVVDSVSLAFYERGWRGVHVEPTPRYAGKLRAERLDETVVEAAISLSEQPIRLFEFADTGLSTSIEDIAQGHAEKGFQAHSIEVPGMPLSRLLDSYDDRPIHWLKIDVEGMEEQVIASWAPSPVRPWIVVVESTRPTSPEHAFTVWEPQLLALGYEFVYFDGLNRFYVGLDHQELRASFGPGPHIFDDFALSGLGSAPFCRKVNAERTNLQQQLADLEQQLADLQQQLADHQQQQADHQRQLAERVDDAARLSQALDDARAEAASQRATFAEATSTWAKASAALTAELAMKNEHLAELSGQIRTTKADNHRLAQECGFAQESLAAMYRSTSWRITAPMRLAARGPRQVLRSIAEQLYHGVRRYPVLKRLVWSIASTLPPVKRKLVQFAENRAPADSISTSQRHEWMRVSNDDMSVTPLSIRARQIFTDLDGR